MAKNKLRKKNTEQTFAEREKKKQTSAFKIAVSSQLISNTFAAQKRHLQARAANIYPKNRR